MASTPEASREFRPIIAFLHYTRELIELPARRYCIQFE
jgi:hypothetical protein